MLYAKIVVGLAVSGPFDYIVPSSFAEKAKIGSRAWVDFRNRKIVGYITDLSHKTNIKKLKNILGLIDDFPLLSGNLLLLTKKLSDYYCCSWGEAIETALPEALRKGRPAPGIECEKNKPKEYIPETLLIHDLDGHARWGIYLQRIKETLTNNQSVIILLPDIPSLQKAKSFIDKNIPYPSGVFYRKQPRELDEWLKVKRGEVKVVIGTRSSIFAPLSDLGLIIIDEEQDSVYKQDQAPHYHARDIAFMRAGIEKTKLILGSPSPSLESFYLAKKNRIKYLFLPRTKNFPETKIIDTKRLPYGEKRKNLIFSKALTDSMYSILAQKGKTLLFLNRKGFATYAACHNCGKPLRCPRCNINLVYHFKENILTCHYCNFKMELPKICPSCNSGYIKFSGVGTEKIESELSRIFPQAKIQQLETKQDADTKDADISVATSSIIKNGHYNFDLIGVLALDNSLNRVDFRASEKVFALLIGLLGLTDKLILVQTDFPEYHLFEALVKKDVNFFYEQELKQRKQLKFPPYRHLILIKLRGKNEEKAKEASYVLFEKLKGCSKNKSVQIAAVGPGQPAKLRGNFYWQILVAASDAKKAVAFLKIYLKDFSHSGIIVTVDVDPI